MAFHLRDELLVSKPRLLVCLEEDKGSDHDVLAAGSVVGRSWVDAGSVERPARDGTVDDRVVALEHRDLSRLLLGKPVPLVVGAIGEAGGLADAVVVDAVVGNVPSNEYDNYRAIKVTAREQASQIVVGKVHDACLAGPPHACTRTVAVA